MTDDEELIADLRRTNEHSWYALADLCVQAADALSAAAVRYRAEGWDEGYKAGYRDGFDMETPETKNPYRTEGEQ